MIDSICLAFWAGVAGLSYLKWRMKQPKPAEEIAQDEGPTRRQCFIEGERAYWIGYIMDDNPFPHNAVSNREWEDGWQNAFAADKSEDELEAYLKKHY